MLFIPFWDYPASVVLASVGGATAVADAATQGCWVHPSMLVPSIESLFDDSADYQTITIATL